MASNFHSDRILSGSCTCPWERCARNGHRAYGIDDQGAQTGAMLPSYPDALPRLAIRISSEDPWYGIDWLHRNDRRRFEHIVRGDCHLLIFDEYR